MVKRHTYTVSQVEGRVVLTYEDQGHIHKVEHRAPAQQSAEAQQRHFYRNLPRKERYKAITTMLQPLLHSKEPRQKLPYKYLSQATGVPVKLLKRARVGRLP
jgi:hypothetical protein